MLRPATPLTLLLAVSFVLLLLSVISTPIVKGIPIATFQGVNFGVFGYCTQTKCSGVKIGYTTGADKKNARLHYTFPLTCPAGLFEDNTESSSFQVSLSSGSRRSLSSLLVVHPVAAFLNLVCLALAAAAHLHSPSHSTRYLLALLILLLPTLLVTLLAFLVDILLFVPHLQWAGWIVLVSTILITASGAVTCAMRRMLVSRKARKKRIAENAEMSGENFYNRQNTESKFTGPVPLNGEPNPPLVNGAPGANRLPAFATYDAGRRISDEEEIPLNRRYPPDGSPGGARVDSPLRSGSRGRYEGPRDEYGNPLPPSNAFGPPPGQQRVPPNQRPPDQFNNGMGPYRPGSFRGRGHPRRGGYGPRGGFNGPRGPPPRGYGGRGGYPGDGRGGFNPRGRGGYPPDAMAAGPAIGMGRPQRGPPPNYATNGPSFPPTQLGRIDAREGGYSGPSPPPPLQSMAANGPLAGSVAEMDASPGRYPGQPSNYAPAVAQLRDSDSDVQGFVDLQQSRAALPDEAKAKRSSSVYVSDV